MNGLGAFVGSGFVAGRGSCLRLLGFVGFRVLGSGFRGLGVWVLGFRDSLKGPFEDCGFRLSGLGFQDMVHSVGYLGHPRKKVTVMMSRVLSEDVRISLQPEAASPLRQTVRNLPQGSGRCVLM